MWGVEGVPFIDQIMMYGRTGKAMWGSRRFLSSCGKVWNSCVLMSATRGVTHTRMTSTEGHHDPALFVYQNAECMQ